VSVSVLGSTGVVVDGYVPLSVGVRGCSAVAFEARPRVPLLRHLARPLRCRR
jgi:hypothetical protein